MLITCYAKASPVFKLCIAHFYRNFETVDVGVLAGLDKRSLRELICAKWPMQKGDVGFKRFELLCNRLSLNARDLSRAHTQESDLHRQIVAKAEKDAEVFREKIASLERKLQAAIVAEKAAKDALRARVSEYALSCDVATSSLVCEKTPETGGSTSDKLGSFGKGTVLVEEVNTWFLHDFRDVIKCQLVLSF